MEKMEWWVTHSLDKLFPQTEMPPKPEQAVFLKAAGNETEDFQIALRPPDGVNIESIETEFVDLMQANGNGRITADAFDSHWVWYTWVMHNPPHSRDPGSWLRNAPGFFPDGFLENKQYSIKPEWTQPLWVSVRIPTGTPAGAYTGELILKGIYTEGDAVWGGAIPEKQPFTITIPLTVEVWPFDLPEDNTLRHTEWFFPDKLADYYRLEPWSEEHWQWIRQVALDMAAHHQDMILTDFLHLVRVEWREGKPRYDFTKLDRWIDCFRSAGVGWIEGGHVAARIGGWESDFGFKRLTPFDESGRPLEIFSRENMPEEEYTEIIGDFLQATYAHLEERWGLERIVQHVADEPLDSNRESWLEIAKQVKSRIPQEIPTIDAAFSENLGQYIDIRVPQIQEIDAAKRSPGPDFEECLWSYVCLVPQGHHPNRFLDQRSVKNRILFWLAFSLRLEGFLHWGYNFWGTWCSLPDCVEVSPWTDATAGSVYAHKRQPLPAGDPFIVYPGRKKICSSIRWEVIRKGMQDHKLLTFFAAAAEKDNGITPEGRRAQEIISLIRDEVAKDSTIYCREGSELLALRNEIGDLTALLTARQKG